MSRAPDRRLETTFGDKIIAGAIFLIGLGIIFYVAWPELRDLIFSGLP